MVEGGCLTPAFFLPSPGGSEGDGVRVRAVQPGAHQVTAHQAPGPLPSDGAAILPPGPTSTSWQGQSSLSAVWGGVGVFGIKSELCLRSQEP